MQKQPLIAAGILLGLLLGTSELLADERADDHMAPPTTGFSNKDFIAHSLGSEQVAGRQLYVIEMIPRLGKTARATAYSRIRAWYDPQLKTYRRASFWDTQGQPSSTIYFQDLQPKSGRVIACRIEIIDHQTDHWNERITVLQAEHQSDNSMMFQPELFLPMSYTPTKE